MNHMITLKDPRDDEFTVEVHPSTPARVVDVDAYSKYGIVVYLSDPIPVGYIHHADPVEISTKMDNDPRSCRVMQIVPPTHTVN